MNQKSICTFVASALAGSMFTIAPATLYVQDNFDGPPYSDGFDIFPTNTQKETNGWEATGFTLDTWKTVASKKKSGLHSLRHDFGGHTNSYANAWITFDSKAHDFVAEPLFVGKVSILMEPKLDGNGQPLPQQTFWGLDAWEVDTASRRLAGIRIRPDGEISYFSGSVTAWVVVDGVKAKQNEWNDIELWLDYRTRETYGVVNGTRINFDYRYNDLVNKNPWLIPLDSSGKPYKVGEFDIYSRVGSSNARSVAYFDDYSVQAVPEPTTLSALALFALAFAKKRRK